MKDEHAQPGREDFAPGSEKAKAKSGATARDRSSATPSRPAHPAISTEKKVELTHPDKVLFPEAGLTKKDVFAYYRRIADRLLPFLKDRPVTLERLPEGLAGDRPPHFWQKDTPEYYPDWIPRVELPTERGESVRYALVNDLETLLFLVNQGTLTFHVWASRVADLDRPDFVLFDLDPGQDRFADAVVVARALRATLEEAGHESFVKTSGKRGLHVLVPWSQGGGYEEARAWALETSERVAATLPEVATVEIRKVKRGQRVYLDVLQNARGHHAVPPYVLRAVPGATISTPLSWKELGRDLDPAAFNPRSIFRRLSRQRQDPLAGLIRTSSGSRRAQTSTPQ